jgi:glutamyl-tRNA reductase
MRKIRLIGLNHATAPLAVREAFAFGPTQTADALAELRRHKPDGEFVLLSTCNRTELYHAADEPLDDAALAEALAGLKGQPSGVLARSGVRAAGRAAVEHLFRVACGLGSMVPGETQILGQVGSAYERARRAGCVGGRLNPLFQKARAAAKQVQRQTPLGAGRVSVARVAVDYAKQIFDDLPRRRVAMIGAGEMGRLVLRHLAGEGVRQMTILNRNADRAATVAAEFGGVAAGLDQLADVLARADVAVCCTGADEPVVTADLLRPLLKKRGYRPLFLIDLGVPRDVEAAAGELENVYRYDLDDLQRVVSQTLDQRTDAVAAAEAIVTEHVESFMTWQRQRELGPTIAALYDKQHALANEELTALLASMPDLPTTDQEKLRRAVRRLVNRLMHAPVRALRERGPHEASIYRHALTELFELSEE